MDKTKDKAFTFPYVTNIGGLCDSDVTKINFFPCVATSRNCHNSCVSSASIADPPTYPHEHPLNLSDPEMVQRIHQDPVPEVY